MNFVSNVFSLLTNSLVMMLCVVTSIGLMAGCTDARQIDHENDIMMQLKECLMVELEAKLDALFTERLENTYLRRVRSHFNLCLRINVQASCL